MNDAISVKSPFSHNALFGFIPTPITAQSYERKRKQPLNSIWHTHLIFKTFFHRRPLAVDDAVIHGVADEAVGKDHVFAQRAFTHCADALNRALRFFVAA